MSMVSIMGIDDDFCCENVVFLPEDELMELWL